MLKTSSHQKNEPSGKDRRREDRFRDENKVIFSLGPLPGESKPSEPHPALTFDLSPGGVRIVTSVPLTMGAPVQLDLTLARIRKLIHVTGAVRWVSPLFGGDLCEAGIEFVKISPEDRLILLNYAYKQPSL